MDVSGFLSRFNLNPTPPQFKPPITCFMEKTPTADQFKRFENRVKAPPSTQTMAAPLSDEELARRLQEELDAEQAAHLQVTNKLEVSDIHVARRMQEEADVEDEFERASRKLIDEQQNGKVSSAPAFSPCDAAHQCCPEFPYI